MARTTLHTGSSRGLRIARRVGWCVLWLALGIACLEFLLNAYGKYRSLDSAAYGMFLARRGWLWLHLAGGAVTVLLGPVQLLARWRQRQPRRHRLTGRTYLAGMLVAATGAAGLISTSPAPFTIRLAFAATALAWLATALVGLIAIRRGAVAVHRRWMTMHYVVTLAPIIFRLALQAAVAQGLAPSPTSIAALLWLSWLLPLSLHAAACSLAGMSRPAQARHARASAGGIDLPRAR